MQIGKARLGAYLLLLLGLNLLSPAFAQRQMREAVHSVADDSADTGVNRGFPTDWSSRHVIFAGGNTSSVLVAGFHDPRHVYNKVQRMVALRNIRRRGPAPRRAAPQVDWSVSLENGFVPANQFPAKFRFDVSSQSCNDDYVLFGLTVNSGTQANLVGINNLYTEATPRCNGGTPWVAFGYNTVTHSGGQIRTSPVLSVDGKKVAFVESTTSGSYFHVLVLPSPIPAPPSQTGSVRSPATPTSCANPITPSCMSTVQISAAANTLSSPWIDYNTDTAYVGTDNGRLYKISPVFGGGAPAVVNDTNWPVTVVTSGSSLVLTGAVVDPGAGRIFVGDGNGYLYAISLTNPLKATAARVTIGWVGHGAGTGIVDPPIVVNDSANPAVDQVFAFTGCSNIVGIGGAVNQIPANFTSASTFTSVDLGSSDGLGSCTTGNVHGGTFDNQFWINGTTGGHMIACGFVPGTRSRPLVPSNPRMYMFPFNASHALTSTGVKTWTINNTRGDECSPLTEFFDGTTDRMFFGVGSTADGFVESSNITAGFPAPTPCSAGNPNSTCVTAPRALGGTSGSVIDNQVSNGGMNIYFTTLAPGSVNGQNCRVTGGLANPYCAVKLTQSGLQ
jgi:hypothetical protein